MIPTRAQSFRNRLHISKSLMKKGRRRAKLPRKHPPKMLELDYAAKIMPLLELAKRQLLAKVGQMLPHLAAEGAAARADSVSDDFNAAADAVSKTFFANLNVEEIKRIAADIAAKTAANEKAQNSAQIKAAFGVDVIGNDLNVAGRVSTFVAENVALIKSIPSQFFADVEKHVTRAVSQGQSAEQLAKTIEARFGVAADRAKFIARDQTNKFFGQVAEARQTAMGVTHYIWRTANDERVRDEHAAREGERFAWDDPPEGGNPGEDFQCRCVAEPDLTPLLEGDEPIAQVPADEEALPAPAEDAPAPTPEPDQPPAGPTKEELQAARDAHEHEKAMRLAEQEIAREQRRQAAEERARQAAALDAARKQVEEALAARQAAEKAAAAMRSPSGAPLAEAHLVLGTPLAAAREKRLEDLRAKPVDPRALANALGDLAAGGSRTAPAQASVREELDRIVAHEGARASEIGLNGSGRQALGVDTKTDAAAYFDTDGRIMLGKQSKLEDAARFFEKVAAGEKPGDQIAKAAGAREEYLRAVAEASALVDRYGSAKGAEAKALKKQYDKVAAHARELQVEAQKHVDLAREADAVGTLLHETLHGHSPDAGGGSYVGGGKVVEEVATEAAARRVLETRFGVKDAPVNERGQAVSRAYDKWIGPLANAAATEASKLGTATTPDAAYEKLKNASLAVKQDHTRLARGPRDAVDVMLQKMSAEYGFTPAAAVKWEDQMRAHIDALAKASEKP